MHCKIVLYIVPDMYGNEHECDFQLPEMACTQDENIFPCTFANMRLRASNADSFYWRSSKLHMQFHGSQYGNRCQTTAH
jgi:hypothetical protein